MFDILKKTLASVITLAVLGVLIIDTTPTSTVSFHPSLKSGHQKAQKAIRPWIGIAGLWQGSWTLFAPNPDRVNSQIMATVYFTDGTEENWNSPDYLHFSPVEKFLNHRRMEFFDNLQISQTSGSNLSSFEIYRFSSCFNPFCEYLRKQIEKEQPGKKVKLIELSVRRSMVPEPADGQPLMPVGGRWQDETQAILTSFMFDDLGIELEPWPNDGDESEESEDDESDPDEK